MRNEIRIGIDGNLSCGANSSIYPFGKVMFGSTWEGYDFYKITDELTDSEIYLLDTSEEGKRLTDILKAKLDVIEIDKLALQITLEHTDNIFELLKIKETYLKNKAFSEGVWSAKKEIREVLGL